MGATKNQPARSAAFALALSGVSLADVERWMAEGAEALSAKSDADEGAPASAAGDSAASSGDGAGDGRCGAHGLNALRVRALRVGCAHTRGACLCTVGLVEVGGGCQGLIQQRLR